MIIASFTLRYAEVEIHIDNRFSKSIENKLDYI